MRRRLLISLLSLAALACSGLFVPENPGDDAGTCFDILWNEFDQVYSHFIIKDVNWDSLYAVYRPQINEETTSEQLFEILCTMLVKLQDGHVNLYSPVGYFSYTRWRDRYLTNFDYDVVRERYLFGGTITGGGRILYGEPAPGVGYIHIMTFTGEGDWIYQFDEALDALKHVRGLIIDVRSNGGGRGFNSDYVASRFTDKERVHAYVKYRNGPSHDDFTELYPRTVQPSGDWQYTKPVIVLTNRGSYSSAETFVLAMDVLPHVMVIGDTTGGGGGNPVHRELPNGWVYRLPVWLELTPEKEIFEGIGLAPDSLVWISYADHIMGRDTILQAAIDHLYEDLAKKNNF